MNAVSPRRLAAFALVAACVLAAPRAALAAPPPEASAPRETPEVLRTGIAGIQHLIHLSPIVGVGWASETGTTAPNELALYYTLGLNVEIRPALEHAIWLSVRGDFYQRSYLGANVDPAIGRAPTRQVEERKWNIDALYAYDLLEAADPDRRIAGELLGGVLVRSFDNTLHPQRLAAPAVGFRIAYAVSASFDLSAHALYGFNLVPLSTEYRAYNGEPRSVINYAAALGFRVPAHSRVRFMYTGEILPLGRTYRHYHGANLAYDVSF